MNSLLEISQFLFFFLNSCFIKTDIMKDNFFDSKYKSGGGECRGKFET